MRNLIKKVSALEEIYIERYPDVSSAKLKPFTHWLIWGVRERRVFFPNLRLALAGNKLTVTASFDRDNTSDTRIPLEVLEQFDRSSEIEMALPTTNEITNSRFSVFDGSAIRTRTGVDPKIVKPFLERRYQAILITSRLVTGGAEKYLAKIAGHIPNGNISKTLVISTEDTKREFEERDLPNVIETLRNADHLFWSVNSGFPDNEETFARFVRGLSSEVIFVCNSDLGYRMLDRFSKGIATSSKLVALFFSFGNRETVTWARLYARKLIGKVTIVSDNSTFVREARDLDPLVGETLMKVIPAPCEQVPTQEFMEKIKRRFEFQSTITRWLWIGRIETHKDIDALAILAKLRPRDKFELFGTVERSPSTKTLFRLRNVYYKGFQKNWKEFPFERYAGLIFTSSFEGMPNTLLECSQEAIPMIISDVGGIRDTFDERNSLLVKRSHDPIQTAQNFDEAIGRLLSKTELEMRELLIEAHERVASRHSEDAFGKLLRELLENG
ncbi:glycosyltransferase [Rhodoluna lacicola]|uniref:glycosyltransferase n=1 Tax=Rhodoluna lacicola TaxID=529884 RepID=UPI00056E83BD|nr:glycosyltransferase [Rhodoluna lacicola]